MEHVRWMWVAMGGGVFTVIGAAMDWDWFMNSRQAQFFVTLFGRDGARLFYALLGVTLVGMGVAGMMGPGR